MILLQPWKCTIKKLFADQRSCSLSKNTSTGRQTQVTTSCDRTWFVFRVKLYDAMWGSPTNRASTRRLQLAVFIIMYLPSY